MAEVLLGESVEEVIGAWAVLAGTGEMSRQSVGKFGLLLERFRRFGAAHDVVLLSEVSAPLVSMFVDAQGRTRHGRVAPASLPTRHLRRSVLRMFFRTARGLGLTDADPARDIALPARSTSSTRPLGEDEAIAVRLAAEFVERPSRHAAAAALALAGGFSGEIGHTRICDLDLVRHRVWIHGSHKATPRWCPLDVWSKRVLAARAALLTASPPSGPAPASASREGLKLSVSQQPGSDEQLQARSCVALTDLLRRVGLAADPAVRPASVTAYAGSEAFRRTGRIETAALRLGMSSLDSTAALIGHDWRGSAETDQTTAAEEVSPDAR